MAKYSGDQVAHNPEVVANYLRVAPTTRLATRQIQFLKIHASDSNFFAPYSELPNSNFSKAVRGVQAQAEVVIIGSPNGSAFVIGVYADTMNDGNISDPNHNDSYAYANSLARTIGESVTASLNGATTIDVDLVVMYGLEFLDWNRAINYVDPTATPATIGANYAYQGQSSYENELFTNGAVTP